MNTYSCLDSVPIICLVHLGKQNNSRTAVEWCVCRVRVSVREQLLSLVNQVLLNFQHHLISSLMTLARTNILQACRKLVMPISCILVGDESPPRQLARWDLESYRWWCTSFGVVAVVNVWLEFKKLKWSSRWRCRQIWSWINAPHSLLDWKAALGWCGGCFSCRLPSQLLVDTSTSSKVLSLTLFLANL